MVFNFKLAINFNLEEQLNLFGSLPVTALNVSIAKEKPKEKEQEILKSIQEKYDAQTSPYYAAARLWTDGVINPLDTRKWISMGIEAANHAPIEKQFNLGVIQV